MSNQITHIAMDGVLDVLRLSVFGFCLTVANDVKTFLALIILFGLLNFAVGLAADLKKGNKYQHKKAFHAFVEYMIAMVIITFTAAGTRLIDPTADAVNLLRALTTLFALIYGKNIIRNLRILQPKNEFVKVLNMLINARYLDFIKKLKNETFHDRGTDTKRDGGSAGNQQRARRSGKGESSQAS